MNDDAVREGRLNLRMNSTLSMPGDLLAEACMNGVQQADEQSRDMEGLW